MRTQGWQMAVAIGLGISGAIALLPNTATAQLVADPSLGTTVEPLTAQIDLIKNGARSANGANLFHSFQEFNIGQNRGAYFIVPDANVLNILARVTGSNPSQILGMLGTRQQLADGTFLNTNANLFLMNPNGIIFGQGARLDVGGSFVATTANAIQFGDRGFFSATKPEIPSSLLTINPSAFLFNQIRSANITINQTQLGIPDGSNKTLLLLGGDVMIDNSFLFAGLSSGRVDIGGVTGEVTVPLLQNGNNLQLGMLDREHRADVTLTNQAGIGVLDLNGGGSGDVTIQARNVSLLQGSAIGTGIPQGIDSRSNRPGSIDIDATGTVKLADNSGISIGNSGGVGDLGSLTVSGKMVELLQGSYLSSFSVGQGNAGNITVKAEDMVLLSAPSASGRPSAIQSSIGFSNGSSGIGNSGNILIYTPRLILNNRALVSTGNNHAQGNGGNIEILVDTAEVKESYVTSSTFGAGNAGNVMITALDRLSFSGGFSGAFSNVGLGATGTGGNIQITTKALDVSGGAQLSTATFGRGDAGNVVIAAHDQVTVDGTSSKEGFSSFVSSSVEENGVGRGGDVRISTGSLKLSNGGQILASTFGQGNSGNVAIDARNRISLDGINTLIASSVGRGGIGNGGDIHIAAYSLDASNGTILISSSDGRGNAGNVVIQAQDTVSLGNSLILSNVGSPQRLLAVGNVGNIFISARIVSLTNTAQIQAGLFSNSQGNAGSVSVQAKDSVSFTGLNSGIFNDVEVGAVGNGSDVQISTGLFSLTNGAVVVTSNAGKGNAGNIRISADTLSLVDRGFINAALFGEGRGGDINLNIRDGITLTGLSDDLRSSIATSVTAGARGRAGDINIQTSSLSLEKFGSIIASTLGEGNAGNIRIQATNQVALSGDSLIISNVQNDSAIGNGGDIHIDAGSVSLREGGQINAFTRGRGNAGTITIAARDTISLDGSSIFPSGISVLANSGSIGTAGTIDLTARRIQLSNGAFIVTSAASGNGGNIILQPTQRLTLRRGSYISANAGTAQAGGNGGNITINGGFIIAIPKENSDITANAFSGTGGNITISSPGIFGLKFRPKLTEFSDITASSDFGNSGTIQLNAPDNAVIQNSLTEFPQTFTDTTQLLANSCIVRSRKQNGKFFITGSGGLPVRPGDAPLSPFPTGDVGSVRGEERGVRGEEGQGRQGEQRGGRDEGRGMRDEGREETYVIQNPPLGVQQVPDRPWKIGDPIVEPQGVYRLANGDLVMSRECP